MTIQEAWRYGRAQLTHVSSSPGLDARLLLQHVLTVTHSFLVAHADEPLTAVQEQRYRALIARAQRKEPVPYLTGSSNFYGLEFRVTPDVLIPRPESERLVELALEWAQGRSPLRIVDVGTGSGCIAVTLAVHLPQANVIAVDTSAAALSVAQHNVAQHAPGRVALRRGHLLEPVTEPVDLIVANLPYVADSEWTQVDDAVKWYEPAVALRGGPDGLQLINQLLQQARDMLHPTGAVFLEIGWQQGAAARALAQAAFPAAEIEVVADYAGHDRIVVVRTT